MKEPVPLLIEIFGENLNLRVLSIFLANPFEWYEQKAIMGELLNRSVNGQNGIDRRVDVCLDVSASINMYRQKDYLLEREGKYRLNVMCPDVQAIIECMDVFREVEG